MNGLLYRLYVHQDFQGVGIASALLQTLESEALFLSMQEVQAYASVTAKPFFENRGYTSTSIDYVDRKGITLTNFLMKKRL
ncbi:GNAT family N-acetyltransferase [Psychrobacillus sp. NPDC096426]|uniref:GNAT family N-acetyltransferase n=1 Tax=Psychrobacillus sp. NPDC096426 TaxID=3364491 RepID=UPI00381F843D